MNAIHPCLLACLFMLLVGPSSLAESNQPTIVIQGKTYYYHPQDGTYHLNPPTTNVSTNPVPTAGPSPTVVQSPNVNVPSEPNQLPYFRYLLNKDAWDKGRCGATGIDLRASNITPPQGICKIAVTAGHCLRDALGDGMGQLLLGDTPGACKGSNAAGVSAQLKLTKEGATHEVYAVLLNHDLVRAAGTDFALILIPCNSQLEIPEISVVAESVPVAHGQYRVYLTRWYPGQHFDVSPFTDAFSNHAITLNPPFNAKSRGGDSGSPIFFNNRSRWELAGVLSGADDQGHIIVATDPPNMTSSNKERWVSHPKELIARMLEKMSCREEKLEQIVKN